ncbi:MAG: adenylate/guanylate cyclase domain-containing protein [Hyphomicrobiales bacterium]|nr:adenylate/guanylate cyclase domain-containing protein [Hyphomicrobiales bacterium]
MERRLVAILAADVAGYSRLMHADEESTLAAWWSARREVIDPLLAAHGGRLVKHTGDGFLAEFATAQGAVRCAMAMQTEMAGRDTERPAEDRLRFRMGINLAEIVDDSEDIHGDGVNIAARLEALAEPGGICISRDVHNQVHHRIDAVFEDMGEQSLKNISRKVTVYRIRLGHAPAAAAKPGPVRSRRRLLAGVAAAVAVAAGIAWTVLDGRAPAPRPQAAAPAAETTKQAPPDPAEDTAARPGIAVLPFSNRSGDAEQDYFSDGMTEDLITSLAKVSGLTVVSRNSSFAFKGRAVDVREVGRTLGARYVVEGSVRRSAGRLRITAQLTDTQSGHSLWAERYDRDLGEVFALQDEVIGRIVTALQVTLTPTEQASLGRSDTDSIEAYDWYLRGLEQHARFNETGNARAIEYLQRAIDIDPRFARAHAYLGWAYARAYLFNWTDRPEEALQRGFELTRKAVDLDPSIHTGFFILGMVELYRREHGNAIAAIEKALELAPQDADNLVMLAFVLSYSGMPERALPLVEKGMKLNPSYSHLYVQNLGMTHFLLGRYGEAIAEFRQVLERNPENTQTRLWLTSALAHAGLHEEARWEADELLVLDPAFSLDAVERYQPFKNANDLNRFIAGLRKAGLRKAGLGG